MRTFTAGTSMQTPAIQDYAAIGNCRATALVSRFGSVDWLCWPRYDSPSLFGALLDSKVGGRWAIHPREPFRASRRYVEGTNVLETRFETASGAAVLVDWMPVADEDWKRRHAWPENELLRLVRCEGGRVELEVELDPRPLYGTRPACPHPHGALGLEFECRGALVNYRTDAPEGNVLSLRAGDVHTFSLSYSNEAPAVLLPLGARVHDDLERSVRWWQAWSQKTRYAGPHRDAVLRSALALKLLAYAPSGAIVAAPTTSLPERLAGRLNWDYRYCWLRDASLTARALYASGHGEEAAAFVSWLLGSTRLTWPRLRILYDVYGNKPVEEHELRHWSGFGGARPVRVGNAAMHQLQLDVYGEVVEAAAQHLLRGGELDRDSRELLVQLGRYVCDRWSEPDEGIWEWRGGRQEHTFSRLMCWAAIDRLLDLQARFHLRKLPVQRLRAARHALRHVIERRGWNPRLGAYTQTLDGDRLDASMLRMPWYGFTSAEAPRMQSTWRAIRRALGADEALLYRYVGPEETREGAFGICSFWGAEFLALGGGTLDEATEAFSAVVRHANDVGLFAEEIDPVTGDALGNFPQGFTHIGLINAALTLEQRLEAGEQAPVRVSPRATPAQETTG